MLFILLCITDEQALFHVTPMTYLVINLYALLISKLLTSMKYH